MKNKTTVTVVLHKDEPKATDVVMIVYHGTEKKARDYMIDWQITMFKEHDPSTCCHADEVGEFVDSMYHFEETETEK